jgi:endonuclease III
MREMRPGVKGKKKTPAAKASTKAKPSRPAETPPRTMAAVQAKPTVRAATPTRAKAPAKAVTRAKAPAGAKDPALVERARKICRLLIAQYPDAHCMLDHKDPFQLLVATILAAQCTDERVNMVTPALFDRFPTPVAMARADIEELETLVRSTGFFHNKAKSILGASEALARDFPQRFPDRMEDLLTLPGVGRKTANVILGTCFDKPAIIVDTHVRRLAQRLGLATSDDPDEIEKELQALLPQKDWTGFSNALTFHGRRCCSARSPDHEGCAVRALCPSRDI